MKAIASLRYYVNEQLAQEITPEILEDLGFFNVLANTWKLTEPIQNMGDFVSNVRVHFIENDEENTTAIIEASNIYGKVQLGNEYIGQSATLKDLLNIVEMLKI